jgi:transaldolase/glucose-6-phosphate isomerase
VPDALEASIGRLDLTRCLVIVASKSGSTIEPNAIGELLFARLSEVIGAEAAGRHFVAITDPESPLEARAIQLGFLGVAHGLREVGGRFSALSPFGQLPAEAMGLDPEALQARARLMSAACAAFVSPERNPGVSLGLAIGVLSRQGRDKLTLSASSKIESFLGWIDQLVAESTGKEGRGITPIVGEALLDPSEVGADRVFVDLSLADDPAADARESKLAALEAAGHPVIRIQLASALDLVQEVFRWEVATAVAGSLLSVNPFTQPDVDAAKEKSREFLAAKNGEDAPAISADLEVDGVSLFASPALESRLSGVTDPVEWMRVLLDQLGEGDVFGFNVFLEDEPSLRDPLELARSRVGRKHKNATTLAIGPRYLHSSGQLQKGGPNTIVGLQVWQSAASRTGKALEIPQHGDSFDRLAEAQAAGDFVILGDRGRRMIGVDVGADPQLGVEKLADWITGALA